jgi:hypothetical protein
MFLHRLEDTAEVTEKLLSFVSQDSPSISQVERLAELLDQAYAEFLFELADPAPNS